jgi:hypothetical protein
MHAKRLALYIGILGAFALAACSPGATPQLISTYPRTTTVAPPPGYVYNVAVSLDVSDVSWAAQQAARLAGEAGGYQVAATSWSQAGHDFSTLTLSVPPSQFDSVLRSITSLGRLLDEQFASQPAPWPADGPPARSIISVTFSEAAAPAPLPPLPSFSWSPVHVFSQAFGVFASIFVVIIDVLIWVTVVVGPFVLIALGLRWLIRRIRGAA